MGYEDVRAALEAALRSGYREQIALVDATEAAYALLDEGDDELGEAEILTLRVLLAQAETQLGRYFGM
ncbi:MAG: hypothetical protein FJZ00_10815 [Candidatus Sericytochromatia bacterium]|uniref:Uncharacterized protein n=1 Tax=Candidatus Tanganyikabacteria bacterium TaxID=2961651 RepID=A0A937X3Z7_9BACT|nr:hypothetical protein [Candidatus Tanganyikabacteria bacterium]